MRFPNPLIPGFSPDPSVVLVDGVYYLVTSTFEYLPGIPVYRSTDLVTWTHIGNVATRPEQAGVDGVATGGGVWAPTIRYQDGVFYVIVIIAMSPRGCVVFTATDPAGPWSDGITIDGVVGIDPGPRTFPGGPVRGAPGQSGAQRARHVSPDPEHRPRGPRRHAGRRHRAGPARGARASALRDAA
jgi:hypothetical protein